MITFAPSVVEDRLRALTRALDSHPTVAGKMLTFSGVRPANGAAVTGANVNLAVSLFALPSADNFTASTLTILSPATTLVQNNGVASWARMVDGYGAHVADLDMGVDPLTDDVLILKPSGAVADSAQLYSGGELSVGVITFLEV